MQEVSIDVSPRPSTGMSTIDRASRSAGSRMLPIATASYPSCSASMTESRIEIQSRVSKNRKLSMRPTRVPRRSTSVSGDFTWSM